MEINLDTSNNILHTQTPSQRERERKREKKNQQQHDVTAVHYTNPDIHDLNNYEIINNEILFTLLNEQKIIKHLYRKSVDGDETKKRHCSGQIKQIRCEIEQIFA